MTNGEIRVKEDVILTMTGEFWFRFGRDAWVGVYAFMLLENRNNSLDYAQKNMRLYAVRLWLPEYTDDSRTSVVLSIFEGEFLITCLLSSSDIFGVEWHYTSQFLLLQPSSLAITSATA
jgi:hypothetical protein